MREGITAHCIAGLNEIGYHFICNPDTIGIDTEMTRTTVPEWGLGLSIQANISPTNGAGNDSGPHRVFVHFEFFHDFSSAVYARLCAPFPGRFFYLLLVYSIVLHMSSHYFNLFLK